MISKLLTKLKDKVVSVAIRIKRYFSGLPEEGRIMWGAGTLALTVVYTGLYLQSIYVHNACTAIVIGLLFLIWFKNRKSYLGKKVQR